MFALNTLSEVAGDFVFSVGQTGLDKPYLGPRDPCLGERREPQLLASVLRSQPMLLVHPTALAATSWFFLDTFSLSDP